MKRFYTLLMLAFAGSLGLSIASQAQGWDFEMPKAMLVGDCQHVLLGQLDPNNTLTDGKGHPIGRIFSDSYDPKLSIQLFVNGQPNSPEKANPNGCILSATSWSWALKTNIRKMYYRAPDQMPDKNPVEIKAIVTPATGPPITVITHVYVLAERWTFQFFQALRYKCYEGGASNPRNNLAVDMGVATGDEQKFHFTPGSINYFTGEATATLDGNPEIFFCKPYEGGACNPNDFTANLNWGDDDQSKIKDVQVTFTGQMMKVDYKIDYMNYLGWSIIHNASGKTLQVIPRRPGKQNEPASFTVPLQKKYLNTYRMPPDMQVMLHVASGIQLLALD